MSTRISVSIFPAVFLSIAILMLLAAQDASAQACGPPPPRTVISTPSYPEMTIVHSLNSIRMGSSSSDTIQFGIEGISANVAVSPDGVGPRHVNVSNGRGAYDWGNGIISLSGYMPGDTPISLDVLPSDAYQIWTGMMSMVGEAMESDEFWAFIDAGEYEDSIRGQLAKVRDGYYMPQMAEVILEMRLTSGEEYRIMQGVVSRGYVLKGPMDISIQTSSPVGDENPYLYISTDAQYAENRWNFALDSESRTCKVTWDNSEPFTDEDWAPVLENIVLTIEMFQSMLPGYIEFGILEPDSESRIFFEKALEGLTTFAMISEVTSDETE